MLRKIILVTVATILILCLAAPVVEDYTEDDEKILNVVVIAGQSNGVYMSQLVDLDLVNEEIPQPPVTCWFYGNGYIHDMTSDGEWIIGNVDPAMAYEIAKYSNNDTLVINACVGGKNIEYFTPGNDGADWITEVVTTAMSRTTIFDKVHKIGWAWIQGESDKTTPVDDYIADFAEIDEMFKGLGFNYCWISQTRTVDGGNAVTAQEKIVESFPNVYWGSRASDSFTVENGMIYSDNLHYTQAARIIIGEDIGSAMTSKVPFSLESTPYRSLIQMVPLLMIACVIVAAVKIYFFSNRD